MQAGIAEYWKSVHKYLSKREEMLIVSKNSTKTTTEETEVAYMNGSVQSLFKIFLVLHALNRLALILEIVRPRLFVSWNHTRERHRYRRAILVP